MNRMDNLFVYGPRDYTHRDTIMDGLIEAICEYKPDKVVTNDEWGFNDIVAELVNYTDIPYERIEVQRDKYGASSMSRILHEICRKSSSALVFNDGSHTTSTVLHFITRHQLPHTIINV